MPLTVRPNFRYRPLEQGLNNLVRLPIAKYFRYLGQVFSLDYPEIAPLVINVFLVSVAGSLIIFKKLRYDKDVIINKKNSLEPGGMVPFTPHELETSILTKPAV
jgi:hypothetical protein